MKKSALAVASSLVIAGAVVGGLFGSRAQAKADRYTEFLRRYTHVLKVVEDEYVTEVDPKELVHASIRGMLRTLDPHSNFLPKQEYTQLQERQQGSYHGLGISVQMRDGSLTVISPFEGTPAYRLGIRSGDVISKIEGEETRGMELDDAVKRLRGPKGSEVTISVTRAGYDQPLDFTIVRDKIDLRSVLYAFLLKDDVGYLRISDFTETTEDELHENLVELQMQGAKKLVLDLRDNPGGLLDQAVAVSNKFLKKGALIVYTRGRTDGSDYDYVASRASSHLDMPLVVLVNRGSASASEIVSGAIQDHDRGLIVGETTFGKGLVQSIYRISEGNGLALTTAQYFTPSGRSIQRDYSGSIDDYYYSARAEEPPAPHGEEKLTDAGRKVYSGGGIEPDIHVSYPRLPQPILALNSRNTFFKYATRVAANRAEWLPLDECAAELANEDGWSEDDYETDEEGHQQLTDEAWERRCEEKEGWLRERVAQGTIMAKGRGRNIKLQWGAFDDLIGRESGAAPEDYLGFQVVADERSDQVETDRRLLGSLQAVLNWKPSECGAAKVTT